MQTKEKAEWLRTTPPKSPPNAKEHVCLDLAAATLAPRPDFIDPQTSASQLLQEGIYYGPWPDSHRPETAV